MINGMSDFIFRQKILNLLTEGKEFEISVNDKTYIFYLTMDSRDFNENINNLSWEHGDCKIHFGKFNFLDNSFKREE